MSFLNKLKAIVSPFIGLGRVALLALTTLQLPVMQGGLSLPNFLIYYWAAILVTVRWWFSQPRDKPAVTLEAAIMGSYAALSNLAYRGVKSHPRVTGLKRTTITGLALS